MSGRPNSPSLETLLAQADHFVDPATGAVVPAIQTATTFARGTDYELPDAYVYGRYGSPTIDQVEAVLAKAEGAHAALVFASGMAAFTAVMETVDHGSRIVVPRIMYHGGLAWLRRIAERRSIDLVLFDQSEPGALELAVKAAPTALVWIESPVNPTWDVIDIVDAVRVAHANGAVICVDSTVAPPVTTRPLELGADIVFHSATKYLNGHSDVNGGVLASKHDTALWREIEQVRGLLGSILPPFEAWLLLRGLRTLSVRFEKVCSNALQIAQHFEAHAKVEQVLYPGLASHPGHAIASSQMTGGFGGMMSLLIKGGPDDARRVASRAQVWVPATSLGGVESLIEHRAAVEGPDSEVPGNLLRLSVGIENAAELIDDLEEALA